MIKFEYMQDLSELTKEELKNRVYSMPEEEARELLFGVLSAMFRHDRTSAYDIENFK